METGAETFVLEAGFGVGIVLVVNIDFDAGLAGRFEGVCAVEVGVVVADVVVEAVGLVHGPLGGGAEAGGAIEGVACWSRDGCGRAGGKEGWACG